MLRVSPAHFLHRGKGGHCHRKEGDAVNILVVTDHFTRLAGAYVTPSQTAPVVAKTLSLQFFREHGRPEKIITDQGKSFKCTLIREFCALLGIQKIRTCCYRPQGNGQCERFNSTLLSMITSLPATTKEELGVSSQCLVPGI